MHPHHPIDPSRPTSPDPVYWVTPGHLAGDDGVLAERIDDTLTDLGWRMWPTSRSTLLKRSMLSTMTLYWMHGEHAETFQLRYEPGELRLDG